MSQSNNFILMARYNQWMNEKLYRKSAQLDETKLLQDRGAFFKSILGTLNHILVGDIIWLKRFAAHPTKFTSLEYVRSLESPSSLGEILYLNLQELKVERERIDSVIIEFANDLTKPDCERELDYTDTRGNLYRNQFGQLVQHFFNHQTHHRGQVTTLLYQLGIDVGTTDLLDTIRSWNPSKHPNH